MAYTTDKAFELIESAHERGRLAHAFLITGDAGSGKEELAARVVAMVNANQSGGEVNLFGEALVVEAPSLDELEGEMVRVVRPQSKSRRIRVDDMRELEKSFHVVSAPGMWKVGVVLHADRMNESAENAFLKTLEEPPPSCLLLLLTDAPDRLLPTILSRCVQVPLMGKGQQGSASMDALLGSLKSIAGDGFGDMASALSLRSAFSGVLAKRKAEIGKLNEAALKEEVQRYKNTTEGDWLKKREEFYKAQTESEYLSERGKLLEGMISWMGDVIRQKNGVDRLDFPEQRAVTARVAEAHALEDLLMRMDALVALGSDLETNVQEQLALEVAFMNAFG